MPVIRLSPATYFRARFVSTVGEPLTAPRLNHQSVDVSGGRISTPPDDPVLQQVDSDGTVTLGPLPRGVTTLALDTPPLAVTRLTDLLVTGAETLLDGGIVTVQPGAVLQVEVLDGNGVPLRQHDVVLEDAIPLSPALFRPARTNEQGHATFDRLGPGRYRVRTRTPGRCGGQPLSIGRLVAASGSGTVNTRLIVGGTATFRVASPLGPLGAIQVSARPDTGATAPPAWLRASSDPTSIPRPLGPFGYEPSCGGSTDADGRITLINFPPGPARVEVHLLNSTSMRRVNVPVGAEVPIVIPEGYLPVRVTNAVNNQPVASAAITWTADGAGVEATASANGEALLEGVGATAGTLAITARGYQRRELKLPEPPAILYEVALQPAPLARLQPRVVTASGEPLPNAVLELLPENPIEVSQVAVTDAKGLATFADAPPGVLRLIARADGFVPAMVQVAEDRRTGVVFMLSRGYRVIASAGVPPEAGPHLVRVVNEAGVSMDGVLDTRSDRSVQPPGRLSLGPLPPGTYVVEVRGAQREWQERVRIVDRDVYATFR